MCYSNNFQGILHCFHKHGAMKRQVSLQQNAIHVWGGRLLCMAAGSSRKAGVSWACHGQAQRARARGSSMSMSLLSTWYALPQLLHVPDRHMDRRYCIPTIVRKI